MMFAIFKRLFGPWDFWKFVQAFAVITAVVALAVFSYQLSSLRSQVQRMTAENATLKLQLQQTTQALQTLQVTQVLTDQAQSELVDKKKANEERQTQVITQRKNALSKVQSSASSTQDKEQATSELNIQAIHSLRCQYWPNQCQLKE